MERSGCTHCSKSTLANKYFGKNLNQWENILNGLQRALNIIDFYYPIDNHGDEKVFAYLGAQRITTMVKNQEALLQFGDYSTEPTFRKIGENHLTHIYYSIKDLKDAVQVYVVDYETWCRYKGIDLVHSSPIYRDPIGVPVSGSSPFRASILALQTKMSLIEIDL
jgi:hypothetical protein